MMETVFTQADFAVGNRKIATSLDVLHYTALVLQTVCRQNCYGQTKACFSGHIKTIYFTWVFFGKYQKILETKTYDDINYEP